MLFNQINNQILIGFSLFLFFWLFGLSFFLFKALSHYQHLVGKTKKQDLKNILDVILAKIEKQEEETKFLHQRCEEIEKKGFKHLQKIGFLRFNPFSDTGGEQSFVLSLLDGEDNGIIVSSLHSRGATRIYAKPVKKGRGEDIKLSKEEEIVVKKASNRRL